MQRAAQPWPRVPNWGERGKGAGYIRKRGRLRAEQGPVTQCEARESSPRGLWQHGAARVRVGAASGLAVSVLTCKGEWADISGEWADI
eukprot:2770792-Rhodomonas_salina.1